MRTLSRRARLVLATAAVLGLATGVWWAVDSPAPTESADSDGYLGLRRLLEGRGATVDEVDGESIDADSVDDHDVVFVVEPSGVDRDQLAAWHRYVAAGGHLVLGRPDTPRPDTNPTPGPARRFTPGTCALGPPAESSDITLSEVRSTEAVAPFHVHEDERSCYGDGEAAIVTEGTCRAGVQTTLATPVLFSNESMGAPTGERPRPERRGNASLAALLMAPTPGTRVAVVTSGVNLGFDDAAVGRDEPVCGDTPSDDSLWRGGARRDGESEGAQSPDRTPNDRPAGDGDTGNQDGTGASGRPEPSRDGTGQDGTGQDGAGQDGSGRDGAGSGSSPGDPGDGATSDQGDTADGGTGQDRPSGTDGTGDGTSPGGSSSDGEGDAAGTGTDGSAPPPSIWDFLSDGLKLALAQMFAALVWYAWRRSRRVGVVVHDEVPVELRSSRLVEAVGALRRRGGETDRAAEALRRRTVAHLRRTLHVDAAMPTRDLAALVATRTGRDPETVATLLDGPLVTTEDGLTRLADELADLRATIDRGVLT